MPDPYLLPSTEAAVAVPNQLPMEAAEQRILRPGHGGPGRGVQRLQPRHGRTEEARPGRAPALRRAGPGLRSPGRARIGSGRVKADRAEPH